VRRTVLSGVWVCIATWVGRGSTGAYVAHGGGAKLIVLSHNSCSSSGWGIAHDVDKPRGVGHSSWGGNSSSGGV
jgi:hypothetical protein